MAFNNQGQRKAFFEKLKSLNGTGPKPLLGQPIQPMPITKPVSNLSPQMASMPDQFAKPLSVENNQLSKKTRMPKLQSYFNVKKTGI